MISTSLKHQLLHLCLDFQSKRAENARKAMDEAQQAANSEEKSTAGDKYDTSRAMSQNIRDMNAKQLQEALKDLGVLQQIKPELILKEIKLGSLVITSIGNYFISISAGQLKIDTDIYFAISTTSPLGQAMLNKQSGDVFNFREQSIKILEVL